MPSTATANIQDSPSDDVAISPAGALRQSMSNPAYGTDWSQFGQTQNRASLQAIAQRRAARLNAANIDEREVDRLLDEREMLLKKKFDDGLSRQEERRLNFVRWSLDRIQDARHGSTLDDLESAVELYERLGADIADLIKQLQTHAR